MEHQKTLRSHVTPAPLGQGVLKQKNIYENSENLYFIKKNFSVKE